MNECTGCERLQNDYDQLLSQLVALEDQLIEIHAAALSAVSIEERREAWLDFAHKVA